MVRYLYLAGVLWLFGQGSAGAEVVGPSPQTLSFTMTAHTLLDLNHLPAQPVWVATGPAGATPVPFRAEVRPFNLPTGQATDFVIVSPSSGLASATSFNSGVTFIALNPRVVPYMRPGTYSLYVVYLNMKRADGSGGAVQVTLTLRQAGKPEIVSVSNTASMQPGISPGQVVTIQGSHLSSPPVVIEPDSTGLFPKEVSYTRVTFNGIPAPILAVSQERIDCVVPYGVAGRETADVVVELLRYSGLIDASPAFPVPVADTSPGIYTADGSGSGPARAINTGDGTGENTESQPASKGSTVTFFATGAGEWDVAYPDGSLVIAYWSRGIPVYAWPIVPLAPVAVTIGGQAAEVVEAKAQKLKVSGMLEVTARIPEGVDAGAQPMVLKVGENDNSKQAVTVWVR